MQPDGSICQAMVPFFDTANYAPYAPTTHRVVYPHDISISYAQGSTQTEHGRQCTEDTYTEGTETKAGTADPLAQAGHEQGPSFDLLLLVKAASQDACLDAAGGSRQQTASPLTTSASPATARATSFEAGGVHDADSLLHEGAEVFIDYGPKTNRCATMAVYSRT